MTSIGIVADDLTGGTTVGALLARRGVGTTVLFGRDSIVEDAKGVGEAVIVSTDSRPVPPDVAFGRVRRATEDLLAAGARQFSKRIDTTCRGGIGPEIEGMLAALSADHVAVIVPAMPQSRRIVVAGYSVIDSVLLSRTGVAQDVRTPVTESHLPTLLGEQLTIPFGHVPIAAILAGRQAVTDALVAAREGGARAILVDAASLEDVELIAQAVVALNWKVVCVDPGPFTEALAVASGAVTCAEAVNRETRDDLRPDDAGTVLVVAGSATEVTHTQIGQVRALPGTATIGVEVEALLGPEHAAETARARGEAARLAASDSPPRVVVLTLDTVVSGRLQDQEELRARTGLSALQLATSLAARLGYTARCVADELGPSCAGFYLTGGDTMVQTVGALGASGITLVDFVIPQVDQGVLAGGPFDGVPVVCKGGLTGTVDTAVQSINRIFDERSLNYV